MSEQAAITNKNIQIEEDEIDLRAIYEVIKHNWYWFILSVIICLSAAIVYLMWAPKMYERTATVLIKDEKTSGGGEMAMFQDLAFLEGKTNVNNEMVVFKSRRLMENVVKRLHLDVQYTLKEGLRTNSLYTNTPVAFTFKDTEETLGITLKAKLLPDNKITLWGFKTKGLESEHPIVVNLKDTVKTPVGKLVATPTLYYNEAWLDKTITVIKSDVRNVVTHYHSALNVSLADKQTSIINLSIKDASIQCAEDVLNTVIAIYNEEAINDKNIMAVNTENFINDRLIIIEQELGNVDERIQSYKTEQQLTDIQSDAQIALQESSENNRQIIMLQNQRSMATYIRNYLSDQSKSTDLIPSNTGVEDINLESQIVNYNETLLKRNRLIENSSERNPVVQDLNNSLNAMRQNIIRAVDNLIVNLEIQLSSIRARTARTQARISAVPRQETEVMSIGRQQQIKESLYLYLLNKREENALNKAITENTARIIDPATGSLLPVAPRTKIILVIALMIGLAIPGIILFILMVSDITVRNQKDLRNILSIPFLGEIPLKKARGKDKTKVVVVKESGRDAVSEAFRIVRTNMDFMQVKQNDIKVITVTSTIPGSGKTFISSNLAVSIAMTGKKVLLLDMDIRKGSVKRKVTISTDEDTVGLTSYLSNIETRTEALIVQDEALPGLDLIYSGPIPPNPAELLLSSRLDELIEELRTMYDCIIIDNVPTGIVADAMITNRVTDLTLYVIRAGKMDRRMLPEIERLYREKKLKNMAVILNSVGIKGQSYGYGYGYGYE